MIKAIIFDFDGVILESADIKTEAFRELFKDYPESINEIVGYHMQNAGISRYVKFRHIYKNIIKKELSAKEEHRLGELFSQLVFEKILKADFVSGAKEFLDAYKNRYIFFIASGTPEDELQAIIHTKSLEGYFKEIHGSPKKKKDIVCGLIEHYGFFRNEVVYVGDADSDRIAAEEAGIFFIERNKNSVLVPEKRPNTIRDLNKLNQALGQIEL